jgi:hypothetical protein
MNSRNLNQGIEIEPSLDFVGSLIGVCNDTDALPPHPKPRAMMFAQSYES